MAEIKRAGHAYCWFECRTTGALIYCLKKQHGTITTLENSLAVSYTVKHLLMLYPVIMLLGIYPRELKAYI